MARVNCHVSTDMGQANFRYGEILRADSSVIMIIVDEETAVYRGHFYYIGDEVYGTIRSYLHRKGSDVYLEVGSLNVDANEYWDFAVRGDAWGAYAYVMSKADIMVGSPYADRLIGFAGDDVINGARGHDRLLGSSGDDWLYGSVGSDLLQGGHGSDVLRGGSEKDVLYGNHGADYFVFRSADEAGIGRNRDIVADFEQGLDLINVKAIDADPNAPGDQAFAFVGGQGFSGDSAELRHRNGIALGDINGDGRADFQIEVSGSPALGAADFIL
jgi:Ca2+-binding RTX toxin-like protein